MEEENINCREFIVNIHFNAILVMHKTFSSLKHNIAPYKPRCRDNPNDNNNTNNPDSRA